MITLNIMKTFIKKFFKIFFSLWVQILFLSLPLYILLWLKWIPAQLFSYIKVTIVIIAVVSWFKWIRFVEIFTRKNKRLLYPLVSGWIIIFVVGFIIFNIFSVKKGEKLNESEFINKQWIYFSQEWVLYYFDDFPNKVGFDINRDWFVDIRYDAKKDSWEETNYDVIGWLLWFGLIIYLIKIIRTRFSLRQVTSVFIIVVLIISNNYFIFWVDLLDAIARCRLNEWAEVCEKYINIFNNWFKECKKCTTTSSNPIKCLDPWTPCDNLKKVDEIYLKYWSKLNDLAHKCQSDVERWIPEDKSKWCNEFWNYKSSLIGVLEGNSQGANNKKDTKELYNNQEIDKEALDEIKQIPERIRKVYYDYLICYKKKILEKQKSSCDLMDILSRLSSDKDAKYIQELTQVVPYYSKEEIDEFIKILWKSLERGTFKSSNKKFSQQKWELEKKDIRDQKVESKELKTSEEVKKISEDLQKFQIKLDKVVENTSEPISPRQIQYLLTYKKQIDATKEFLEKTKENLEKVKKFVFSEKEIKTYQQIIKNWKDRKDLAIWKRYLLNEEYKIHKVLKENAKNLKEYMDEMKYYNKKAKKLQKEIEELERINKATKNLKEDAEKIVKNYKNLSKLINVVDKLQSAVSILSDAGEFQDAAKQEWVKLDDGSAIVASTLDNTLWNLLNDNPWDQAVQVVWDALEKVWDKLGIEDMKDIWEKFKKEWSVWWQIKQAIEYAVTTDEKTFEDMKEEYDRVYQEEVKNAWVLKKSVVFLKYKVVWKAYYRWIRWLSKTIRWTGSLINKIKSWF